LYLEQLPLPWPRRGKDCYWAGLCMPSGTAPEQVPGHPIEVPNVPHDVAIFYPGRCCFDRALPLIFESAEH
jgi:hypothetical protein